MQQLKKIVSILLLVSIVGGWSEQDSSSVAGSKKNDVNFYGSLDTHQGKKLNIDNISIDRLYKQVPLYAMPAKKDYNKSTYKLTKDPRTAFVVTKIDLAEVAEISVPNPEVVYVFQKEKGYREDEYIQITVVSNNEARTQTSYLISKRKKIYVDEINKSGPVEKEVPLEAIKLLKIDGYKRRDSEQKKES